MDGEPEEKSGETVLREQRGAIMRVAREIEGDLIGGRITHLTLTFAKWDENNRDWKQATLFFPLTNLPAFMLESNPNVKAALRLSPEESNLIISRVFEALRGGGDEQE